MRQILLLLVLFTLVISIPVQGFPAEYANSPDQEMNEESRDEATTLDIVVPEDFLFGDEKLEVTQLDITAEGPEPAFNEFNLDDFIGVNIDMTVHGDLWLFTLWNDNPRFIDDYSGFTEVVARVGADFAYGSNFKASFRIVGTDVHNNPEERTMARRTDWGTIIDLANISFSGDMGSIRPTMTIGWQELSFGDGLLIYDGFSEKRAVWSSPIRSFPAVRWTLEIGESYTVDIFSAMVHENFLNYETYMGDPTNPQRVEGGGQVSGVNVNILSDLLGEVDAGIFYKDDDAQKDNPGRLDPNSNTYAVSLRDEVFINPITITGEIVKQWGRTKVVENALDTDRHSRSALGGQISAEYAFTKEDDSPYVKARWAQFQGDRHASSTVEAFDPFFSGSRRWGEWYLGDMTSFFYPNTNKRTIALEFGMTPIDRTQLTLILYDISLDEKYNYSGSPQWSNEANLIFEYMPCDWGFVGILLGVAKPEGAAKKFHEISTGERANETQTEVALWAGFSF